MKLRTRGHLRSKLAVSGNRAYVADHWGGLLVFEIAELPAITRTEPADGRLILEWNEAALGMRLQRATIFTGPDWVDLPESETTNGITLPIWSGNSTSSEGSHVQPHRGEDAVLVLKEPSK